MFRAPNPIASGTVGVFAPAGPFDEARLQKGLEVVRGLGFAIKEPDGLRRRQGYLAGSDDHRLAVLHQLLDDPEVDVLWAARGGYGVHRIVERIDPDKLLAAQKPIVGFSDLCALHAVAQRAGLISIHGPVLTQLGELEQDAAARVATVVAGHYSGLTYPGERVVHGGRAEGRIVGGCLSVLVPMLGSPYLPDFDGSILMLEDVGEATYRIDRMLTHLRLAGVLGKLAGIALGDFHGCRPQRDTEPDIDEVLSDRLGDLGIPVLSGLPFGHGRRNLAVPLGTRAVLDADGLQLVIEGP